MMHHKKLHHATVPNDKDYIHELYIFVLALVKTIGEL